VSSAPRRLVLLGHPVAHSLSPALQNAALEALGVPLRYEALDVPPADLDATLEALIAEGAAGNVTLPHKVRVAGRCRMLTDPARRAGAVNVFWTEGRGLGGDNTDIRAFAALAESVLGGRPEGVRLALLGAGGAAAAVLTAAEGWPGVRVVLHNRSPVRAAALAARFPVVEAIAATASEAVTGAALVVNATSLGLRDADPLPVDIGRLPPDAALVDLVYRPGTTRWVRAAAAAGHRAADGLEMLLEQGALAFERWLGVAAPRAVMRDALARHAGGA
jgi:shikimate dehydrogenase